MRLATLTLVILSLVSMLGCLGASSGPAIQWSKNMAIFAESKDSNLNDDNLYSVGETGPFISDARDAKSQEESEKYTQALLEWAKPQTIHKVLVKADPGELEFFEIQYQDDEGNWPTVRSVKNHYREVYKLEMKDTPIYTRKLRLKVPRFWDSRRKTGAKRKTRGEGGVPSATRKKIREIEVYHVLPPAEPTTAQ